MGRDTHGPLLSPALEDALRAAALWHRGQTRKRSELPYVQHVFAVALVLDRLGFAEDVVIAGLLHDAVEDAGVTYEEIVARFGPRVAELVAFNSERKLDAVGNKRPWIDRKREHLAAVAAAPVEARAVLLADKLHNLAAIEHDLREGRSVWEAFNAPRADVLGYYEATIDRATAGIAAGSPLDRLAAACRAALDRVAGAGEGARTGPSYFEDAVATSP